MISKLLIIHNPTESGFAQALSGLLPQIAINCVSIQNARTVASVQFHLTRLKSTHLAVTCPYLFQKLTGAELNLPYSNYFGTKLKALGKPILFLPALSSTYTLPSGAFILEHLIQKKLILGLPKKDPFSFTFLTPSNLALQLSIFKQADYIAVDIETSREGLAITSVAYTAMFLSKLATKTVVVKVTPEEAISGFAFDAISQFNSLPNPKVMQNGQYDSTYFCRFNVPVENYIYDTGYLQHSLFPELPKDLSYISSLYLDNYVYWKDTAGQDLYKYNGMDTHNTAWVWFSQMLYIQRYSCQYAFRNYALQFPVIFPALSCGLDGLIVDEPVMQELKIAADAKAKEAADRLNYLLGLQDFNPGSSQQVVRLFQAFGSSLSSSDKIATQAFFEASPLHEPIVNLINKYRKAVKASSTYFSIKLLNGRLMYVLNPFGTATARMASSASNFWCGTQVQNIPQYARKMVKAEEGWTFIAVDKAQSESYCTGYIAREPALIEAVTTSPDFHCKNASLFFGIPFEELYDVVKKVVLLKDVRTLSKRTNHGANYNMGANKLLQTMGTAAVLLAKQLLKLHLSWSLVRVCEYLLACFEKTYPRIRGQFQEELKVEIAQTGKLFIACLGYTRRTFLKPWANKLHLNEVVSHKPQSLSVLLVNKAFVRIWKEIQLDKFNGKYRLKAQVHDEILSIATDDIVDEVAKLQAEYMTIPIEVEGQLMTIPSTIATGKLWSDAK